MRLRARSVCLVKVLEVLSHVSKRIKAHEEIRLPLVDLAQQYQDENTPSSVKNFSIIYLEHAFNRASSEEKNQVIPILLSGIADRPAKQQSLLLRLFLSQLKGIKLPANEKEREDERFSFLRDTNTRRVLLEFLQNLLLMVPVAAGRPQLQTTTTDSTNQQQPEGPQVPALSSNAIKSLTGEKPLPASTLVEYKLTVLEFLRSGLFEDNEVVMHYLIASADSDHAVKDSGETALKRLDKLDKENATIVQKVYSLFQGTLATDKTTPPEDRRRPASPSLQERLLSHFLVKSVLATNQFPNSLQIIFESIFGSSSNNKLKKAGMAFVQWTFRNARDDQLALMGPIILSSFLKMLSQFPDAEYDRDTHQLKGSGFVCIGLLAKRIPALFHKDLDLLKMLLDKVDNERSESVRSSVQDALSLLSNAYYTAPSSLRTQLSDLLLEIAQKGGDHSRYTAVQYANRLFPFNHITSRFIDLLAVSDSKLEVREEGHHGLKPYSIVENRDVVSDPSQPFPPFDQMVEHIADECRKRTLPSAKKDDLPLPMKTYEEVLRFLQRCLLDSAARRASHESTSSTKASSTTTRKENQPAPPTRQELIAYWENLMGQKMATVAEEQEEEEEDTLSLYRSLVEKGMGVRGEGSYGLHHVAATSMLALNYTLPTTLGKYYSTRLDWLQSFLYVGFHESRDTVAKLLGFATASMEHIVAKEILSNYLEQWLAELDPKQPNTDKIEGATAALGYLYCRILQLRSFHVNAWDVASLDEYIQQTLVKLCALLTHHHIDVRVAAVKAIGAIGRYSPLPLPDSLLRAASSSTAKDKDVMDVESKGDEISKLIIIEKLASLLRSTTTEKRLTERLSIALGYMCLGDHSASFKQEILDALFKLDQLKTEEIHFTVGESFACIAASSYFASLPTFDPLAPEETQELAASINAEVGAAHETSSDEKGKEKETSRIQESEEDAETMKHVMSTILEKLVSSQSNVRAAAGIWMLSLLKHCGSRSNVLQSNLQRIQMAYSRLLADNNEIVQEVASRGLTLVYEHGNADMKKELIENLVGTLSTGKARKRAEVSVSSDTEVLPSGALGSTPKSMGGGSLSTYKELCSVANELGQPDLIYRFLNLASHQSLWNSRKGAAFAMKTLGQADAESIKHFLPTLVPKLYRYSYDPNPRLAQSMRAILDSLADSRKAVETYFDAIMKELLESIVSNIWRTREAACHALTDILQARKWDQVGPYLEDLWIRCFRAMDDIKESVRNAAKSLSRTLASLSIRLCDPIYTNMEAGAKAIAVVLPFLLDKGIVNDAKEVQSFAVTQILKISKVGGALLNPHVPKIISVLLQSLSVLEPQAFNYLSFHTDKYNVTQQDLENARVAVSKLSPLNDTLDLCVRHVNADNVQEVCSQLAHIISHGVGLPTKAGAARIVVSLVLQCPFELKPHVTVLLKALRSSLKDRSPVIRMNYAVAVANLSKLATERSLRHLISALLKLYKEKGDSASRNVCGVMLLQMIKVAPDTLREFNKHVIPLILLGKNDEDDENRKVFVEVWSEYGMVGSVQLYLKEIMQAVEEAMHSSSWSMKRQGALTLKDVSESIGQDFKRHLDHVLNLLVEAFPGRTWKGKEALLIALSAVVTACKDDIPVCAPEEKLDELVVRVLAARQKEDKGKDKDELKIAGGTLPTALQLFRMVLHESKKRDKPYKRHALNCLSAFAKLYLPLRPIIFIESYPSLSEDAIGTSLMDEENEENTEPENRDKPKKENPLDLVIKEKAFEVLGFAWPQHSDDIDDDVSGRRVHEAFVGEYSALLLQQLPLNTWNVQLAILQALKRLLEGLPTSSPYVNVHLATEIVEAMRVSLRDAKFSSVRKGTVEVIQALIQHNEGKALLQQRQEVKAELTQAAIADTNLSTSVYLVLGTLSSFSTSS
ncbi:proteasome component M29, variant 2 [Balamuthia mandrillaris]